MSIRIDINYINSLSSRLEKFAKKGQHTYNCRCPICGDSQKKKNKARGYFYQRKGGMFYKCHNCGFGSSLGNFIKKIDGELYNKYRMERWRHGDSGFSNYKKPTSKEMNMEMSTPKFRTLKSKWTTLITELDDAHVAKRYLLDRKIPNLTELYFTANFGYFVEELVPNRYENLQYEDSRIIIPFYDTEKNLKVIQGRSVNGSELRYITIKIEEDFPKIYGLDKVDFSKHVYVVEGPFDSMFIPNSIAVAGSDISSVCSFLSELKEESTTFVFDNERRSSAIVKKMEEVADKSNYGICVFPENIEKKDINDIFLSGIGSDEIVKIINKSTHRGMGAKFAISKWKRC